MTKKKALILVDLQNDFCEGGQLAVPGGDRVIPLANKLQPLFDLVVASQDWHPLNHTSFASNHEGYGVGDIIRINDLPQVLWPDHCVQNSKGAEFHPGLDTHLIQKVFHKGTEREIDSYSAFFDNAHQRATGLEAYLRKEEIEEIYILGLATDYCVKFTSLDAAHLGFKVYVIEDACRGVGLSPDDISNALKEMQKAGVTIIRSTQVLEST